MAQGILQTVTSLVSTCSKHVSRAARKLRSGASHSRAAAPFLGGARKRVGSRKRRVAEKEVSESEGMGEGVWRRTILMGDKCQPLDFAGVIYYDSDGRKLDEVPTPRSPLRSPLPAFRTRDPVTPGRHSQGGI